MLLQATGITKHYGTTPILENIHLLIEERERVGLVGVNGAGKSTLLRILADELTADSGEIVWKKDVKVGYLAQNSGLASEETIYGELMHVFADLAEVERDMRETERRMSEPEAVENPERMQELLQKYDRLSHFFREQGGYEMEAQVRGILHGMGFGDFPFNTPIRNLSGGQKTRLALAKLLLQQPDLLILDEPTNYLDIATLEWLENYLRQYAGAVLVVSHDRYFLDAIVNTIVEIERHASKKYTGNYTAFIQTKAHEYEVQLKHFEKQQSEIAKLEDFVQRNIARASTTKRAQSRQKALARMDRMDRPGGELKRASFSFEAGRRSGNDVLTVEDVSIGYGGQVLSRNIRFQLNRGETAALIGANGIGKSTLLKTLIGLQPPMGGTIKWGSKTDIGYYEQEHSDLNPENSVLEEVWNAFPQLEEVRIRTLLGNFLFSGEDVYKPVRTLSGGEKARVALAKLMLLDANVLILDEPTNHLDLYSKEVLESALLEYDGTLLFISHDRYFLNKMAERVFELESDGVHHFLGNYDDYVEKKKEIEEDAMSTDNFVNDREKTQTADDKNRYTLDKQAKKEERARLRRLEQVEKEIADLEEECAGQEQLLTDPDVYQDYVRVRDIQQKVDDCKTKLEALYAEWEQLAAADS